MRKAVVFAVLCGALVLAAQAGARAQASNEPISFVWPGTLCGGEEIVVDGRIHFSGTDEHQVFKVQGTGVSATGTRYRFDLSNVGHDHFTEVGEEQQGAENTQFIGTVKISRLGRSAGVSNKTDDTYERIHTHATRNANGEWTAEFDSFEAGCR